MMAHELTYDTPAIPPPEGLESNFNDPPSLHAWVLGVVIVCICVMTLAVAIRIYTKVAILQDIKHEDYIAVLAIIGSIGMLAIFIYLSSIGYTRDMWNIRAVDIVHMFYMWSYVPLLYSISMGLAKYFVCIQLRRIFCPRATSSRGPVWWALQVLITTNTLFYITTFITFACQCIPREKIWNFNIDGTCIDYAAVFIVCGAINVVLDMGILALPVWAIWHLQMAMKHKIGPLLLFAVGFITCVAGILTMIYRIPLVTSSNISMATAKISIASGVEFAAIIVAGCMPLFPRFYTHVKQSVISSTSQQDSQVSRITNTLSSANRITTRDPARIKPEYIELGDVDIEPPKQTWQLNG